MLSRCWTVWSRVRLAAMACLSVAAPSVAAAQGQRVTTPPIEMAVDHQVRDRWMHGLQRPRFTPFVETRSWILVDSTRTAPAGLRRLHLTLTGLPGRETAIVELGTDGRVSRLAVSTPPFNRPPALLPGDSARFARFRWFRSGRVTLPEPRLWDVTMPFRASPARPGARWTDTIARVADHEGFRQAMRGVRVSTLVGDTIVDGRRLWLVRDSARVRYDERWLEDARTLDTVVTLTRTGDGVIRGRYLYDPDVALVHARADTTTLSGEVVLGYPATYPGVRTFRTSARYERYQHWQRHDRASYEARLAETRAAAERGRGGMMMVPAAGVERRLADGDRATLDSVLAEWQRENDPNERERLFRLLRQWGSRDPLFVERLDSLRVASGDTAYLYRWLAERAYGSRAPADTADVRRMLVFMADPALPLSYGASADGLYENVQQGLTTWPPAVTTDTSRWKCTPAACRVLAEQWRTAREPRLRDVGLVALLTLEPARWADTVLAREQAGSRFLRRAAMLARGVGATWPAASKAPMPPPNAGWETWAEWMGGTDPQYAAARTATQRSLGMPPPRPESRVRFEESHATAIRFHAVRTGRDLVGELRRRFDGATSDSARLVFGTMLQGLGELRLSADEIKAYLRSSQPSERALADRSLRHLFFFTRTEAADSATVLALLDRLVSLVVEGVPAWRPLAGGPPGWAREGPTLHQDPSRRAVFLLADSTPPALREKWKDRVGVVTAAEWARRPLTEGGVLYTLSAVRRAGPFVLVGVSTSERVARREGATPQLYAAMVSYYLMEVNGEWVVVATDAWVT